MEHGKHGTERTRHLTTKNNALFALHVLAIEHGNKMLSCAKPFEAMLRESTDDDIKEQATLGLERIAQANLKNSKWVKGCIKPLADLVRNGLEGQRQGAYGAGSLRGTPNGRRLQLQLFCAFLAEFNLPPFVALSTLSCVILPDVLRGACVFARKRRHSLERATFRTHARTLPSFTLHASHRSYGTRTWRR